MVVNYLHLFGKVLIHLTFEALSAGRFRSPGTLPGTPGDDRLSRKLPGRLLGSSPWIHRRFIVAGYADRVVQEKGTALGASSQGEEGK
jgi:hypothetical protein